MKKDKCERISKQVQDAKNGRVFLLENERNTNDKNNDLFAIQVSIKGANVHVFGHRRTKY